VNRRRWWLVPVILVAAVLLWVVVRRITTTPTGSSEAQESIPVLVQTPRIGAIERILSTSGTLIAGATIHITSKVSGRIEAILVQEGQAVTDGELLVQIEEEAPRLQVEQAHAAWQAAEAQYQKALKGARPEELENARALYEKAEKDLATAEEGFSRSEQLYNSGTIPKAQFEQAESSLRAARTELENAGRSLQLLEQGASAEEKRMARAQAEAAGASFRLARLQLEFTRIRAPCAAVVAKVFQSRTTGSRWRSRRRKNITGRSSAAASPWKLGYSPRPTPDRLHSGGGSSPSLLRSIREAGPSP
jgi:multidrug resistance efflux pump